MLDGDEPDPSVPVNLAVSMLNRHGLIAGATGAGGSSLAAPLAIEAVTSIGSCGPVRLT